jgi:hypothetical protein
VTRLHDDDTPPISALIQLVRATIRYYINFFVTIILVMATRLLPFYIFVWFFPITNPLIEALFETVAIVPVIAALVRHSWSAANGVDVDRLETVLGGTMDEVLKLLATNIMILAIVILFAGGGSFVYIAGAYATSWATLVVDQIVILEGRMLTSALRRSFELVRTAVPLSITLVVFISIPEIAVLILYTTMGETALSGVLPQAVRIVTLPFVVALLTFAYTSYFVRTESDAQ